MAVVTRRSRLTGRANSREVAADAARIAEWDAMGRPAPFVQDYFPELDEEDREFLLTGITPEEWEELVEPEGG